MVAAPEKLSTRLRTIPNTNLGDRKREVLRIHQENLKMVTKLAEMKVKQDLLVKENRKNVFNTIGTATNFRSRSAGN